MAIDSNAEHTLALKSDGTVVAWGTSNVAGEATVPAGLHDVTAIAAGNDHNLALLGDGTVTAWGNDSAGQATVPVGLDDVVAIAAGYETSLALRSDGTVVAWGHESDDVLSGASGVTGAIAVALGVGHSLVLVGHQAPSWVNSSVPSSAVVGTAFDYTLLATGRPTPTYTVSGGALPAGLTLDPSSGHLTGTPTTPGTAAFRITASNGIAPGDVSASFSVTVSLPYRTPPPTSADTLTLHLAPEGTAVIGAVVVQGQGLQPGSPWTLTMFSTPTVLRHDTASTAGAVSATVPLPDRITPGSHRLELAVTEADGHPRTLRAWFRISADGRLVGFSTTGEVPSGAALAATGTSIDQFLLIAAVLLAAGVGALLIGRRHHPSVGRQVQ